MISVCTTQIPGTLPSGGDSESVTSWAGLNGQVTMAEDQTYECIWKILRQVDESLVPLWIFYIIPGSSFINNYIRHLGWLIKLRIHIDVCGLSKVSRVRILSSSLMRSQLDNLDTSVLHFMNKGDCSGEVIKSLLDYQVKVTSYSGHVVKTIYGATWTAMTVGMFNHGR